MAAPRKPWEAIASANMYNRNFSTFNQSSFQGSLNPQDPNTSSFSGIPAPSTTRVAPPLPPRPSSSGYPGMSQYHSPYASPYNSFGSMYNPYGHNGYGYGGFGYNRFGGYSNNDIYSGGDSFVQMAEENTRQAFQSVESVVQAISSVGMMLESTYHAVYSSFRAVIGVADHFGRMKMHLTHIFSILALLRTLRIVYYKLLNFLGLINHNTMSDMAWENASSSTSTESILNENDLKEKRYWPALLFISVIFGTPWLLWKIFSSFSQVSNEVPKEWARGRTDHFIAVAEYDFNGEGNKEISFKAGQEIRLAPKELQPRLKGWLLGSTDGAKTGLVPANYIRILGKRSGINNTNEIGTSSGSEQPSKSNSSEDGISSGSE